MRLCLIQTILWCQLHARAAEPEHSLRTPELRPRADFAWGKDTPNAVLRLAQTRAELLKNTGSVEVQEEQVSGRLLLADPKESDLCGLSVFESGGYIDTDDVPPWDTWVHYAHEDTVAGGKRASYLLCWVPSCFVPHVEKGIAVNPVECFFWATEYKARGYNTALLRQLQAQGLLG